MKICTNQGRVYQPNKYGFNVEVKNPPIEIIDACQDQPYVSAPFGESNIFLSDNKVIKCQSLYSEIKKYEKLGKYPNFLEYYGTTNTPIGHCLVLEYLPNSVHLDKLDTQTIFRLFPQIVDQAVSALEYLHSRGLTHGDIHYGNLLWDFNQNRLVMIDLEHREGSAPLVSDRISLAYNLYNLLDYNDFLLVGNFLETDYALSLIEKKKEKYPQLQSQFDSILNLFRDKPFYKKVDLFDYLPLDLIGEISNKLHINELSKVGHMLNESIWEKWVMKNIEIRHKYDVISKSTIPNKWKWYANLYSHPVGNTIYINGISKGGKYMSPTEFHLAYQTGTEFIQDPTIGYGYILYLNYIDKKLNMLILENQGVPYRMTHIRPKIIFKNTRKKVTTNFKIKKLFRHNFILDSNNNIYNVYINYKNIIELYLYENLSQFNIVDIIKIDKERTIFIDENGDVYIFSIKSKDISDFNQYKLDLPYPAVKISFISRYQSNANNINSNIYIIFILTFTGKLYYTRIVDDNIHGEFNLLDIDEVIIDYSIRQKIISTQSSNILGTFITNDESIYEMYLNDYEQLSIKNQMGGIIKSVDNPAISGYLNKNGNVYLNNYPVSNKFMEKEYIRVPFLASGIEQPIIDINVSSETGETTILALANDIHLS